MKRLAKLLPAAALLLFAAFLGCGSSSRPQAGDVVSPQIANAIGGQVLWFAGHPASIQVRLEATTGNAAPRLLDFSGVPTDRDPLATVKFFDGDTQIASQEVRLSHRC